MAVVSRVMSLDVVLCALSCCDVLCALCRVVLPCSVDVCVLLKTQASRARRFYGVSHSSFVVGTLPPLTSRGWGLRPPTRCPAAMPPSRRGSGRSGALHPLLLLGLLVGRAASILSYSAEEELAADLEAPGVLAGAALRLATAHNEVVFVVTGPDATSMQMANNSLVTLAGVGLRRHTMMMADSWDTCKQMGVMVTDHRHSNLGPTDLQRRPADSVLAPHCALPALRVLLELTRAQGPADPTRREYR